MSLPIHEPVVETDGGPWATHDHACSACQAQHSILHLNDGRFAPCGECRQAGWRLVQVRRGRLAQWLLSWATRSAR